MEIRQSLNLAKSLQIEREEVMGIEILCLYEGMDSVASVDDAGVILAVDGDNDRIDHFFLSWGRFDFLQKLFFHTFGQCFSDMIYPGWSECNEFPYEGYIGPLTTNPSDRKVLKDSRKVLRDFLELEPSEFEANPQLRELFVPSLAHELSGPELSPIPDGEIYERISSWVQALLRFIELALSAPVARIAFT